MASDLLSILFSDLKQNLDQVLGTLDRLKLVTHLCKDDGSRSETLAYCLL